MEVKYYQLPFFAVMNVSQTHLSPLNFCFIHDCLARILTWEVCQTLEIYKKLQTNKCGDISKC